MKNIGLILTILIITFSCDNKICPPVKDCPPIQRDTIYVTDTITIRDTIIVTPPPIIIRDTIEIVEPPLIIIDTIIKIVTDTIQLPPITIRDTIVIEKPIIVRDTITITQPPVIIRDTITIQEPPIIIRDTVTVEVPVIIRDTITNTIIQKDTITIRDVEFLPNNPYLGPNLLKEKNVLREYWTPLIGKLEALKNSPNYPLAPTGHDYVESLEWQGNTVSPQQDNYAQKVSGKILIPATGEYTFWISGDDYVEFYLSTDETKGNKKLIASIPSHTGHKEWTRFSSQKSVSVVLEFNKKYYFELLHKEVGGNDHFAVGWSKPGEPTDKPSELIPNDYLIR